MQLQIRGHHLPGRSWPGRADSANLQVGIQLHRDPAELVPADAAEATWRMQIDLVEREGIRDFRGPAVQGKRGERFVYLVWVNRATDGSSERVGRAKLMIADVITDAPRPDDRVIVDIDLTDESGRPRCARLREPALTVQRG
jgi:hypothetical protein